MNFKKSFILIGVTLTVFVIVCASLYLDSIPTFETTFLAIKGHQFSAPSLNQSYPPGHTCVEKCKSEGGFNCGSHLIVCCESEAYCERLFYAKKCDKHMEFDCILRELVY